MHRPHIYRLTFVVLLFAALPSVAFATELAYGPSTKPIVLAESRPARSDSDSSKPTDPASVEDVLMEKGVLTMDDWIRIKAEEEYRLGERERRVEVLEGWKSKVDGLPILNDKIN